MSGEHLINAAPARPVVATDGEDATLTGLRSTRQFYETHAEIYARATLPSRMPNLWGEMEARLPTGSRILDVGAGAGRDLRRLSVCGYQMVGIDLSFPLMRIATRIPSHIFDGVWSIASLLHIARTEIVPTLEVIRAVMKEGGIFLASVRAGRGEFMDANGRLLVLYTMHEWRDALRESGFCCETCEREVKPSVTVGAENERIEWLVSVATA
jgi:SAM-dependent methyltransferase